MVIVGVLNYMIDFIDHLIRLLEDMPKKFFMIIHANCWHNLKILLSFLTHTNKTCVFIKKKKKKFEALLQKGYIAKWRKVKINKMHFSLKKQINRNFKNWKNKNEAIYNLQKVSSKSAMIAGLRGLSFRNSCSTFPIR